LQAAGADVLDAFVDLRGDPGDFGDRAVRELDRQLLGSEQLKTYQIFSAPVP
jgi:hypothetical protein